MDLVILDAIKSSHLKNFQPVSVHTSLTIIVINFFITILILKIKHKVRTYSKMTQSIKQKTY